MAQKHHKHHKDGMDHQRDKDHYRRFEPLPSGAPIALTPKIEMCLARRLLALFAEVLFECPLCYRKIFKEGVVLAGTLIGTQPFGLKFLYQGSRKGQPPPQVDEVAHSIKDIKGRVEEMKLALKKHNIDPKLITVCRSMRDLYLLLKQQPLTESSVLEALRDIYPRVMPYWDAHALGGEKGIEQFMNDTEVDLSTGKRVRNTI
eukprot:CAMPEP_0175168068 /NCGR_PEP_ID=MMETSP0087-20121206/28737_1 /TAXON_ID=136419 /ORGANISM="Unknown Unknown, Strain D1" /LENGTH=202 /DNA_ID=CAMNT_0016458117 /DNA_START=81 /DNA_END=689 /DNA_ORIENTATION=+